MNRILLVAAIALSGSLLAASAHAMAALYVNAHCTPTSALHVQWTFTEDAQNPVAHPEWTGYDLLRRVEGSCTPYQRVNAAPFVRTPGQTQTFDYEEPAPATGTMFQYRVILVDANRQEIYLESYVCDCNRVAWASCPDLSAPVVEGTITTLGGGGAIPLMIQPCPGSCGTTFFIWDPAKAAALQPYAGTGQAFRFFGVPGCNSFEGCSISPDHWDPTVCDPSLPTTRSTWGRVRAIYR